MIIQDRFEPWMLVSCFQISPLLPLARVSIAATVPMQVASTTTTFILKKLFFLMRSYQAEGKLDRPEDKVRQQACFVLAETSFFEAENTPLP